MARDDGSMQGKLRWWREVAGGCLDLHRRPDEDERGSIAVVAVPTMLMTAQGSLASTLPPFRPRMTDIARAVDAPGAGHWLPEGNPVQVTAELLDSLDA